MEKILGQSAIDALFASVGAAAVAPAPAATADEARYNFGRAGQISSEQMKAIATVHDLFARNLMHTVGAWLRTDFNVAMVSGEQMGFTEFLERISDKTYVCSMRLEPLGAVGFLEVELSLVTPMVDLLLGGTGKADSERALTDIEDLIMVSVGQMLVKELTAAWQPVGLEFHFDRREAPGQVARMMTASERTLCVSFEVKMPAAQGTLSLCLPAVVLNTMLRRLQGSEGIRRSHPAEMRARMRELAGHARIGAVLQFPPVKLSMQEIAALEPGTVLRLPIPRHAVAELLTGGLTLGLARPVRLGEHRGARMEPFGETAALEAAGA